MRPLDAGWNVAGEHVCQFVFFLASPQGTRRRPRRPWHAVHSSRRSATTDLLASLPRLSSEMSNFRPTAWELRFGVMVEIVGRFE